MITVKPAALQRIAAAVFHKAGSAPTEAEAISTRLVGANLSGHDSHGVVRIPRYVELMRTGGIAVNQHAKTVFENDTIAVIDGQFGFGQVIGAEAMAIGIAKAKKTGVAVVALRHSSHLGRIGDWAEACAEAGYASIHFVNVVGAGAIVAPFGGGDRRISTNPFSAGMPVTGGDPIILDMATSKLAEGKVLVAKNKGVEVVEGAIIDGERQPTLDPNKLYDPPVGALLPFGEHKGYGLAVFCDLLAGILSGGQTNHPGVPIKGRVLNNMLSIILDPAPGGDPAGVKREVDSFVAWLKGSPPLREGSEVMVPGEPERRARRERISGVPLDDTTWSNILATAAELGVAKSDVDALLRSNH
ncbi:MAG: malate/lactate/ureidoglycolate dehydrogenase [Proteobacteria bacterium]|nr:malate/lactate/ureidoglycolate dehydrogenase [Pseudomonadota bacterium]MBI3498815.1 malate/lactate/ureidoglycolate dehydrogenase [Pseudomonadota bacterium]